MAALKLPPAITDGLQRHETGARRGSPDQRRTGLRDVQRLAEANDFPPVDEPNAVAISKSICVTLTLITCWLYQRQKPYAAQAGD